MTPIFKKHIESIRPYEPGKPIDEVKRELGLDEVIKVASNENALGVSEKVKRAIQEKIDLINVYPDGYSWRLRDKLSTKLGVDKDEIIFGNGSNEIIEFIAKGFVSEGDTVISSQYAFLVYPLLTQVCGGKYIEVPANNCCYDLPAIAEAIDSKTKVVFLANPNNPTGTYFNRAEFEAFLKDVPEHVIVCLDEAYVDFVEADDYPNGIDYFRNGNVVVLRTFSKACGLAGLRIGYGLASKELISYFNKIRQPFNVNMLAQCAAEAVLDDTDYMEKSKQLVRAGKEYFYNELDKRNIDYLQSETNFILINVKQDSGKVFEACLKRGIVVRAMKAYKLDNFIRVTIGRREENEKVLEVLDEVIS